MSTLRLLHGATNGSVLIDGGRIARAGDIATFDVPDGTQTIDCSGATIVPGYWNAHVHFFERKWSDASSIPAPELAAQLEDFTRYGFTSVFDLSSSLANTHVLRARIASGELAGPRILSTGEGLVPPGALPPPIAMTVMGVMNTPLPEVGDVTSARAAVKSLLDAGADAIKVFLSSNSGQAAIEPNVLAAIADETHRADRKLFVHPNTPDDVKLALRAGADVLAHTTPRGEWDDEILDAAREQRTALIPTLALWKQMTRHDRRSIQEQMIVNAVAQLHAWREAGGIVLFGTDYGAIDADPSDEYTLMHDAGMDDDAILASMTMTPADFFGEPDRGRIVPDCVADLAVVDAPLGPARMTIKSGDIIYPVYGERTWP
jgi:imidazolonepropionase-like amidohydrolase